MATVLPEPEAAPVVPDKAPVAIIVGAGPGLGFSTGNKFAEQGYQVMLMARNEERVMSAAEEMRQGGGRVSGIQLDVMDPKSISDAFQAAHSLGPIEVLVFNASTRFPFPPPKFADIKPESLEASLRNQCIGAFHCAQQVLPAMEAAGRGTLIFTGATASVRGGSGFAEIACAKFALRALAQCLAREFHPKGIHVVHAIIDGIIDTPRTKSMLAHVPEEKKMKPEAIADVYWHLHLQDRSAWAQEIDLRPFTERF